MVTVKGTKSKRIPGKKREPKDGPSLRNVSHFKGAQPAKVVPSEKKKVVKPTVHGPSHASQKAAAERFGDSISPVAPIKEDKDREEPRALIEGGPKGQPIEDNARHSMAAVPTVKEAKMEPTEKVEMPKAQTNEKTPAVRFGDSMGAGTSMPKEKPKEKEKPKSVIRGRAKAGAIEEKVEHPIGAIPDTKEAQAKAEPTEKADSFNSSVGWVELNGKRYDFDVIVHADGSVTKREKGLSKKKKKKYGHTPLTRSELKELEREEPVMIIIGTGDSGSMPLTPRAERFLDGYLYFVGKTPEALKKLAVCEEKAIALLHVTC